MDEGNCPAVGASGNILHFCETALKISGPVPLTQEVGLRLPAAANLATAVTGVALAAPGGGGGSSLVAIIGTADGDILKVVLWGPSGGDEPVLVDTFKAAENEPILPGTALAPGTAAELIVLTPRRVRRLKMADCARHRFCGDCLSRRDPFCGWCSLENECSLEADCRSSSASSGQEAWLSAGSAHHQCIQLENISPGWIPAGEAANISLQISALPELPPTDHYQCLYDVGGRSVALRASKVPGGLECPAPPPEARPAIPAGADHVMMNLAVTLRGGAAAVKEFVSTSIMVFRCGSHTTCLDCVASRWPCAWCTYTNRYCLLFLLLLLQETVLYCIYRVAAINPE